MYIVDQEIEKLTQQNHRVEQAVMDAQAAAIEAREKLPELRKQLGDVILRAALGDATSADVNAARFAVLNGERVIEAAELIMEPARRAQATIRGESLKWQRRLAHRRDYEAIKAKITEAGHAKHSDMMMLRDLCLVLNGDHTEADSLLAGLGKPATA